MILRIQKSKTTIAWMRPGNVHHSSRRLLDARGAGMIRLACIQLYIDSIVVRKGSDRARFEQIVWRASLCRAPMPITTAQYAYPRYLVHQLYPKVP
jgi:hypothetical protein